MTPFRNPTTPQQRKFNQALARVTTENTHGQWKRRYDSLHMESRRRLKNIPVYIFACAVLHNYAKDNNLPNNFDDALHE